MLCQFKFKNFNSYRDETLLDLNAANIEEFSDSLFPPPGNNFGALLPIAVIYGPNAGGKSNAVNALAYLISRVVSPIYRSTSEGRPFGMFLKSYSPFLFDDVSKTLPTEFEITFRTDQAQYVYRLSLFNNTIREEALSCIKLPCARRRSVVLFRRDADNAIELGSSLKKANTENVSPTIPYLSFLAINYNFPEINRAVTWFQNCFIQNFAIADSDHRFSEIMNQDELKPAFLSLLESMDIPISDYVVKESAKAGDEKEYNIVTTHTVNGRPYTLDLTRESEGTIKIVSALPGIVFSLIRGGLVLFDEFDAKLHPHLLRFLINCYTDPELNKKHAQLIFTCHDISIMRNDVLRRDEIWFAATNRDGASELWSLYDIQDENGNHVKNTAAYDRQYLAGRYGADPYLKKMIAWGDSGAE